MTVRNDKELIRNIRELSYACLPGWIDGDMGGVRALVAYDSLVEYIDEHYTPKPDITEMTCVGVLTDALNAIQRYEHRTPTEWGCIQDAAAIIRYVLERLGGNNAV